MFEGNSGYFIENFIYKLWLFFFYKDFEDIAFKSSIHSTFHIRWLEITKHVIYIYRVFSSKTLQAPSFME